MTPTPEFLMRNVHVTYGKFGKSGIRRAVMWWEGKRYLYSRVVWDFLHPGDSLKVGEIIHHIDSDRLNDMPDNLQKMTMGEHASLHRKGVIYAPVGWNPLDVFEFRKRGIAWKDISELTGMSIKTMQKHFRKRKAIGVEYV